MKNLEKEIIKDGIYHMSKNNIKPIESIGKYKSTGAKLSKKHFEDAGQDIYSNENIVIPAHNSAMVSTNLYIEIPRGCVGLLWSRSGLSVKHKIEVGAGCIDSNYRGEVKVHLYNHSDVDFQVNQRDRIAQLLTLPVNLERYDEVDVLSNTERGEGGFGSTGK